MGRSSKEFLVVIAAAEKQYDMSKWVDLVKKFL